MRGKIILVTGLTVGYVLGARAGRERYNQIKRAADNFWSSPRVKEQVDKVEDFAKDKAPEVVDFLADGAKKVASQVKSTAQKATGHAADKPAARSTAKSPSTAK